MYSSSPQNQTRPTRPSYIPPHLRRRHQNPPSLDMDPPPQSPRHPYVPSPFYRHNYNLVTPPSQPARGLGRGYPPKKIPHHPSTNIQEENNNADLAINFDAYEDITVEVTGEGIIPSAVSSFDEIEMGNALKENVRRCKYAMPTPVQKHAMPIALSGRDLMACAQTGSGKTAAFCFPIICGVLESVRRNGGGGGGGGGGGRVAFPVGLILSPTRELASQIHEEAKKFAYQTGVKIAVAYGGAPVYQQLRDLERGVDILVATPGRLVDMIERSRISLKKIKYLALDEADRMLDMGFEPQIRKIVEQIDMPPAGSRQTLLFSATFPDEIQRLASDFLSNYIFLSVGRVGSSTDLIAQKIEFVEDMDKRNHLIELLRAEKANGSRGKLALTLVFVETKKGADALETWLNRNGFPATAIHGGKVQMEREQALRSFKRGLTPIMVATDVASRGLDIPNVSHVINFDMPRAIDDYVHRIGRTGRAGKAGVATAFFNNGNIGVVKGLVELMQESKQEVPSWLSECAEKSSYGEDSGRSGRYRGRKFGGHDYRNDASMSGDYFNSSPYANADTFADCYTAATADVSYGNPSGGYAYNESLAASGWD